MKKILFLLLSIGSFACSNNEFKEHESGLQYKFIEHNEKAQKPNLGDGLLVSLKYTSIDDSILFDRTFRVKYDSVSHQGGSIEDAFSLMHKGDSAEFRITAKDFINHTVGADKFPDFIDRNSKLKFYIRLKDISTPEEMESMKVRINSERKAAETMLLDDYIARNEIETKPSESGLFFLAEEPGKGKMPKVNDTVVVHYTGMFLDGTIFDSSRKRNEAFSFILGTGQVIQAWDEGIAMMKIGEKARFIIPSNLAYGKKGFRELIPPFSTLIFDVELLEIK